DFPSTARIKDALLGLESAEPAPPQAASAATSPPPPAIDSTPMRPEMEQSLREVMHVDRFVGGKGLRSLFKRGIVMLCRPFTRRQAVFNERIVAALRELGARSSATDIQLQRFAQYEAEATRNTLNEAIRKYQAAQDAIDERIHREISRMSDEIRQAIQTEAQGLIHDNKQQIWQGLENHIETVVVPRLTETIHAQQTEVDQRLRALFAEHSAGLRAVV